MDGKVFPFTVRHDRKFGNVPYRYRGVFLNAKPADLTWYAADVVVRSPASLEFVMFDMADMVYGGAGSEIARLHAECDPVITRDDVVSRAIRAAEEMRQNELSVAEAHVIAGYADALLAELSKESP